MVNQVILIGRLGKDPVVRYTQAGVAVAHLTLATSKKFKTKDGAMQEETTWHTIIVWGRDGENAGKFLKKGSSVYVEGEITSRRYTDKAGVEKIAFEIKAQRVQYLDQPGQQRDSGEPPADEQGDVGL